MTDPGTGRGPVLRTTAVRPAHADIVRGNHMVAFVAIGALALLAIAAVVLAFTLGRGEPSPGAPDRRGRSPP